MSAKRRVTVAILLVFVVMAIGAGYVFSLPPTPYVPQGEAAYTFRANYNGLNGAGDYGATFWLAINGFNSTHTTPYTTTLLQNMTGLYGFTTKACINHERYDATGRIVGDLNGTTQVIRIIYYAESSYAAPGTTSC